MTNRPTGTETLLSQDGTHLYEQVADRLEAQILADPDKVGYKLPSEQMLAHRFSVSRPVVREALKLLKERRLVSVRNGEGVFVEKPDTGALAKMLGRVMTMERVAPKQVHELRLILEPAACGLAAPRVTDADIDRLKALLQDMRLHEHDVAARITSDFAFHLAIADLSGNGLIAYILGAVRDLFYALIKPAVLSRAGSARGIHHHEKIIAALATRDSELAQSAMRDHLNACSGDYHLSDQP